MDAQTELQSSLSNTAQPFASFTSFEALVGSLDELGVMYNSLYEILIKEKTLLISSAIEELKESNKSKEKILYKIRAADKIRLERARELAKALGADTKEPRLLLLADKLKLQPESKKLRDLHKSLSSWIERVRELNEENETYTQSALKILNGAIDEVKQTVVGKKSYGKQGQVATGNSTQSGNFVSKEA
jgi:hypothetical protein